jgi:hypothetical protein
MRFARQDGGSLIFSAAAVGCARGGRSTIVSASAIAAPS